jgi:O-antigen ligase
VLAFIRAEGSFLILLLLWIGAGMLFAPIAYVLIPVTLLLFQRKKMYLEMLIGFFVILILSDSRQSAFGFAADVKDIYILVLGLFYLIDRASFQPAQRVIHKFLPFLILAVLFLIFSDIILQSAMKTLSYALLLLVVPNYLIFACRQDRNKALRKLIWTGILILIIGFVFRIISPGYVTLADRYCGMLGNPNGLGLFCIMFYILISVARNVIPGLFTKREAYLMNGIILFSIVLCGSRNAVFTIGIFILFHYMYKISPFIGILVFCVIVVVYQVLLANLEPIIYSLDLQDYFRVETLQNASGRLVAWNFGWEKINESPFMGHGIGYTDQLYKINYDFLSIAGHQGNAHNSFITFWLDTGFFGALLYVIAFIRSFVAGAKRYSAAIPAMFAILFSAFFESWLTASLNPFTIQCFIIITLLTSTDLFAEEAEQPAPVEHASEVQPAI